MNTRVGNQTYLMPHPQLTSSGTFYYPNPKGFMRSYCIVLLTIADSKMKPSASSLAQRGSCAAAYPLPCTERGLHNISNWMFFIEPLINLLFFSWRFKLDPSRGQSNTSYAYLTTVVIFGSDHLCIHDTVQQQTENGTWELWKHACTIHILYGHWWLSAKLRMGVL